LTIGHCCRQESLVAAYCWLQRSAAAAIEARPQERTARRRVAAPGYHPARCPMEPMATCVASVFTSVAASSATHTS
jgi:hypothetical protein